MSLISKPFTFSNGATIIASEHNSNYDTVYNLVNGNLDTTNLSASAAIPDSKLNQITTASKVSASAITGLIAAASVFPAGMILLWSGTIAAIPSGWVLCDGSNSTPDLRDVFIVGAKSDSGGAAKTNITGSLTQTGGATTAPHTHTIPNSGYTDGGAVDGGISRSATSFSNIIGNTITSNGTSPSIIPPYFALAYIMKT